MPAAPHPLAVLTLPVSPACLLHNTHTQGAGLLFDGYLIPWLCRYERKLDTLIEVGAQALVGGGTGVEGLGFGGGPGVRDGRGQREAACGCEPTFMYLPEACPPACLPAGLPVCLSDCSTQPMPHAGRNPRHVCWPHQLPTLSSDTGPHPAGCFYEVDLNP